MTQKKIILCASALLLAFATGRYTAQKPTIETKIDTQTDTKTSTEQDAHKKETIVETPDGKKVTTITEDTDTKTEQDKQSVTHLDQTVTPPKTNTINLSVLAGVSPLDNFKPAYGISVSKQVLGPLTIGAFGLNNGVIGASIGINF